MKFTAKTREVVGTSAAKQLRKEDLIPGTVYGSEGEPVNITMAKADVELIQRELGLNSVFDIEVDGAKQQTVFVRNIDKSALKPDIFNISLQAIKAGQKLEMPIPVYIENEDALSDSDGVVTVNYFEINVIVDPSKAPESFTIDAAGKHIGDSFTVADLVVPAGVEVLDDPEEVIVSINAPQEEVEEVAADAEATEPEVIGEKEKNAE